jgi:trimeric autotransporter adhesin
MKTYRFLASFLCLGACALLTSCGGSSSNSGNGNGGGGSQAPTVTSISPTSVMAGSGNLALTVNGSGFLTTTTVQVGGIADPTAYVSGTQVTATVSASQLASGAQLAVIALNGSSSSGSGTPINLQVTNPSPTITSVSPTNEAAGSASPVIAVTGTGFVASTQIQVNGSARTTTYVSATQVNVTLSAADVATPGTLSLTAVNGAPGGGTSTAATVTVNDPVPFVTNLTPWYVLTGAGPTTVTVHGGNFVAASTVFVNGSSVPTTYVSASQLTFAIANQSAVGFLAITVSNPAPGGGTSSTVYFVALVPTTAPVISSVSPTQFIAGSGTTDLYVYGSNFMQQVGTGAYAGSSDRSMEWFRTHYHWHSRCESGTHRPGACKLARYARQRKHHSHQLGRHALHFERGDGDDYKPASADTDCDLSGRGTNQYGSVFDAEWNRVHFGLDCRDQWG